MDSFSAPVFSASPASLRMLIASDEVERAFEKRCQHDWIEVTLVIGDDQHSAAPGNVPAAAHVQVKQQPHENLSKYLGPFPEKRMFGGQIIHLPE